jgi:hypothetical protein
VQQDIKKTIELWTQAAELGFNSAHLNLGRLDMKQQDATLE